MRIEQKRFPIVKKFELGAKRIDVFDKSLNEELEYTIDYLELGNNIVKKKGTPGRAVEVALLAFFALEFGLLVHTVLTEPESKMVAFWLFASGIFLSVYLLARFSRQKNLLYITGGVKTLELLQDKPDVETAERFIDELQKRIKNAYRKEYLNFDESATFETKKHQVDWLNRIDVLSDDEASKLLKDYLKGNSTNIGFRKSNE